MIYYSIDIITIISIDILSKIVYTFLFCYDRLVNNYLPICGNFLFFILEGMI